MRQKYFLEFSYFFIGHFGKWESAHTPCSGVTFFRIAQGTLWTRRTSNFDPCSDFSTPCNLWYAVAPWSLQRNFRVFASCFLPASKFHLWRRVIVLQPIVFMGSVFVACVCRSVSPAFQMSFELPPENDPPNGGGWVGQAYLSPVLSTFLCVGWIGWW